MLIKWLLCAVLIAVIAGVWLWQQRRRRVTNNEEPASIVLLLKGPREVDVRLLASLLTEATGLKVRAIGPSEPADNTDKPAGDMVAGASPHFIANLNGTTFVIHNLATPYVEDSEAASASIPELRLRKAMAEHKAWLSMDVLRPEAATAKAYRIVGHLLANFVGPDCLALYHPPLNKLAPCTEETASKLRSNDPIKAVFHDPDFVPVIPIQGDPRLTAAEAEARRRFPEFEAAFIKNDGNNFSIKARISTETNSEHIWVQVDTITPDGIKGRLGNEPVNLGDLKLGSSVEIQRDQVEDWSFLRRGKPVGLFTVAVIQQIQAENSTKKRPKSN
jgi:uncharacterized protein YegJ (DUF2314 family)